MTHRVFIVMKDDNVNNVEVSSIEKVFYTYEKAKEYIDKNPDKSYWVMEEEIW
jgi:hypothetical protein